MFHFIPRTVYITGRALREHVWMWKLYRYSSLRANTSAGSPAGATGLDRSGQAYGAR
jgi:hypothetical protein